ncbi:helix-turn-helix domain-containing protein [Pseudomonas sp. LS-2]|uniref:helix-turn-helix domain-containing protein n=1 Tax=Pseudomonas sp. LS-2 TaxID=2315859 RepID=UPI000E70FAB3|nr:helix-turn-helix domain-containing protein [Pseudomonas sp. LS-2]RJX82159.1 helix-turn-helix domain-containing protein [Pseudomonas sp. LS-2]
MEYREALGQVLREIRVATGYRREDCSTALSREYLASVERGQRSITIEKLTALCDFLDIAPSLVLFATEARLVQLGLAEYQAKLDHQVKEHIEDGKLRSSPDANAYRGVRGTRAESTRKSIQALKAEGLTKAEVVRRLGVGRSTVNRYWIAAEDR